MKPAPLEVQSWLENHLRPLLKSDEFMLRHAAILKVGASRGDDSLDVLRRFVASIYLDAAGMPVDSESN